MDEDFRNLERAVQEEPRSTAARNALARAIARAGYENVPIDTRVMTLSSSDQDAYRRICRWAFRHCRLNPRISEERAAQSAALLVPSLIIAMSIKSSRGLDEIISSAPKSRASEAPSSPSSSFNILLDERNGYQVSVMDHYVWSFLYGAIYHVGDRYLGSGLAPYVVIQGAGQTSGFGSVEVFSVGTVGVVGRAAQTVGVGAIDRFPDHSQFINATAAKRIAKLLYGFEVLQPPQKTKQKQEGCGYCGYNGDMVPQEGTGWMSCPSCGGV